MEATGASVAGLPSAWGGSVGVAVEEGGSKLSVVTAGGGAPGGKRGRVN